MKYTLADLCLSTSAKYKNRPVFAVFSEGEICNRVTYKQMGERCQQIGSLLRQIGVEKGNRVLLLSDSCPEWGLAYFGIAIAGAVSVPLLTGFSSEQIQNIALHSKASAVCLSRPMEEKFEKIKKLPEFANVPFIYIDSMTSECKDSDTKITVSINEQEQQFKMNNELPAIDQYSEDDLATIIYTSGTQGNSKGVMLSGKNIIFSAISSQSFVKIRSYDKLLSVLPLAHSYECSLGLIAPIIGGSNITYLDRPPSASVLLPAAKKVRPTIMISVPLLIEKTYNNAIAPKLKDNKLYHFPLTRPLAIWVAGRKLISALGGRIRFFGLGGAPLSSEVEKFLYRAKFPYSIGYGLTEAAPLVAGSSPHLYKARFGLVAPKGVSIRVVKCAASSEPGIGEIQVQGPNIMMGYYNDSTQTAETITSDGWLHTGDLGRIEKKRKLRIKGRLKALILGPSGENIYPEEIEGLLGASGLVEDALVYSSTKGELIALVRLTEAAKALTDATLHTLEDLRSWVNKKLAIFSHLTRIEIRHEPFEKTPTMKIKRYLYV